MREYGYGAATSSTANNCSSACGWVWLNRLIASKSPQTSTDGSDVRSETVSSFPATLVSATAHGALALNADGTFSYTPDTNFNGTDGFTYQIQDDCGSSTASVVLEVGAVNDAPVALDDTATMAEDGGLHSIDV